MLKETGKDVLTVFIVSDSIGKTAETVVNAVASQFNTDKIKLKKFTNVTSIAKLSEIINRAESNNVVLAYTIVLPELNEYIKDAAKQSDIPIIDIMGPTMSKFSQALGQTPQLEPGLNRKIDQAYFERIACIDFAIRCDDGKDLTKLKEADIVVIGVSRTSKTPLSMYLAHQGYKVANIPIVPEVTPPQEIFSVEAKKVVGLTISPTTLQDIRQQRLKAMRFDKHADYAKVDRILEELNFAEKIMKKIGCMVIDVTNRSIEETASEILSERSGL